MTTPPAPGFTLDPASDAPKTEIWHLGGIDWYHAPTPRRWHRCRAQTIGYLNYFDRVERCACGAIRMGRDRHWMERNRA